MEDIEDIPEALKPTYTTPTPNFDIVLYEGELEISNRGNTSKFGHSIVYVCWLPEPKLKFRISSYANQSPASLAHIYKFMQNDNNSEVKLLNKGMTASAYISKIDTNAEGIITQPLVNQTNEPLDYIILHLVNFIGYWGTDFVTRGGQSLYRDRVVFMSTIWKLTIDTVDEQNKFIESLRDLGGYGITHVARLEKTDGNTTTAKEIERVISNLFWYFTFLKSSFCPPIFIEGYKNGGEKIFEEWRILRVQPIDDRFSWFPLAEPHEAGKTFTKFMELMDNELWRNILVPAVEWYVGSQKGLHLGVEIVSSQIGLELLSWAKFVEIDGAITKDGFGRLPAADRMGLLLSWGGIPLDIPPELEDLSKYAKSLNWKTGPQAIAEIRNGVAHPDLRDRVFKIPPRVQYETKKLSIWYLELALLKLLDYDGLYHNRLLNNITNVQSELVPWAAK